MRRRRYLQLVPISYVQRNKDKKYSVMPPSCQLHLPKHPIFKSALLIMTESTNGFHSTNLSFFSCYHVPTKNSSTLDYIITQNPLSPQWFSLMKQHPNKVMSDRPGLVDFAIGLVYSVLNLSEKQEDFFWKFKLQKNCNKQYFFWGGGGMLVKMTLGLVHASYNLPEWQVVKLFFLCTMMKV